MRRVHVTIVAVDKQ